MSKTFAFRDELPNKPSWDRDQVAKAIRQARVVGKMAGASNEPRATLMRAGDALQERSKLPAKKFSKEWSDNRDRETLSHKLYKKSFED